MKICCKSRVSYKLVGLGHAQKTYFILLIYSKVTKLFFLTAAILFFLSLAFAFYYAYKTFGQWLYKIQKMSQNYM